MRSSAKSLQLCLTVRPHRRQPTRLPRPWDSPGKNTGVGCHCLLQCVKVKSEGEVGQLCPTPSDPMDCSPPGSSIHGIFQARVLEWCAIAFSGQLHKATVKQSIILLLPPYQCMNSQNSSVSKQFSTWMGNRFELTCYQRRQMNGK